MLMVSMSGLSSRDQGHKRAKDMAGMHSVVKPHGVHEMQSIAVNFPIICQPVSVSHDFTENHS